MRYIVSSLPHNRVAFYLELIGESVFPRKKSQPLNERRILLWSPTQTPFTAEFICPSWKNDKSVAYSEENMFKLTWLSETLTGEGAVSG